MNCNDVTGRHFLLAAVLVFGTVAVVTGGAVLVDAAPDKEADDTGASAALVPGNESLTGVVARYTEENGTMVERPIITTDDVRSIEPPEQGRTDWWRVRVTLTDEAAQDLQSLHVDDGFQSRSCPRKSMQEASRNSEGHCVLTIIDGDVSGAYSFDPQLVADIESGEFEKDPSLIILADNESEAKALYTNLGSDSTGSTAGSSSASPDETGPTPGFGMVLTMGVFALLVTVASIRR